MPQIALSLVDFPEFGFDLTLYGGDVTLLPGLESFLSSVLRDFVIRPFVLPGRFVFDLPGSGGEEAALGFDRPRGMLFVTVEEAARIPRVDLFSAADCYVKVGTTGGGGRKKKKKGNEREKREGEGAVGQLEQDPNDPKPQQPRLAAGAPPPAGPRPGERGHRLRADGRGRDGGRRRDREVLGQGERRRRRSQRKGGGGRGEEEEVEAGAGGSGEAS